MPDRDCAAIGWDYAERVANGEIPNGTWAVKAAQRALDDRQHLDRFRFDPVKANRVTAFIERLTHTKGKLGGKLIKLEPWQCFVLSQAFGWLHDGGDRDGLRRFRTVHLEVGRGNGKSCLSSGVCLYMLAADGEMGAEVYASATSAAQSRIVFNDAVAMVRAAASKKLMDVLGVEAHANTITVQKRNSKFAPTSSEYSTMDGFNIHLSVIDELHAMPDRGLYDVIVTGAGKRPQSMIWSITTAGSDRTGICYEQRTYLTKILDHVTADETMFGCIWCANPDDDWLDERSWIKANPNYNVSVEGSYIASLAKKAEVMPAAQANFRVKHLCQWVSASNAWMDMGKWFACTDDTLKLEQFEGRDVFIGTDLASVSDLSAKVYIFPATVNGEQHYTIFGAYYLSEAAIADGRNSQYKGWEIDGHLTSTPGDATDYGQIEAELENDLTRFKVKEIAFDPYQAQQMMQNLQAKGANVVEVRPNVLNFSAPMKHLEMLTRTKRLHHDGNPVLCWAASNVVCYTDAKDNIYPRKEREEAKIDPIVATIMALARAMLEQQKDWGDLISFF